MLRPRRRQSPDCAPFMTGPCLCCKKEGANSAGAGVTQEPESFDWRRPSLLLGLLTVAVHLLVNGRWQSLAIHSK
jgi:hypothetical protein